MPRFRRAYYGGFSDHPEIYLDEYLFMLVQAEMKFNNLAGQVASGRGWNPDQSMDFKFGDIDLKLKISYSSRRYEISITIDAEHNGEKWTVAKDWDGPKWHDILDKVQESFDMRTVKHVLEI